jgi:hypothetical protein
MANESLWEVHGQERVVFDITRKLPWQVEGEWYHVLGLIL